MLDQFPFAAVLAAAGPQLPWVIVPLVIAVVVILILPSSPKGGKAGKRGGATDAAILATISLKTVPVLNRSEGLIYNAIQAVLQEAGGGHRLLAQVSVGEVFKAQPSGASRSERQVAFNMINAKRFDFLIVNHNWHPVVALEYQGNGHDQGDARKRDAIKRAACKSAGLPFIEVSASGLTHGQCVDLRRLLGILAQIAAE